MIGRVRRSMTAPEREQLERMIPSGRWSRFIDRLSSGATLADRLESLFREDLEQAVTEVVTIDAERVGVVDDGPHSLLIFESSADRELAVFGSHALEEAAAEWRGELFAHPAPAVAQPTVVSRAPRSGLLFRLDGGSPRPEVPISRQEHLLVLGCELVSGTLDEVDAALAGLPVR